nr:9385_t:CDS:2 [Entrophospora candida]
MSLLGPVLMETQNKLIHHAVIFIHNLITEEIVDNVNSFWLTKWLTKLWGAHMKEHCIIDVATALTAITSVLLYSSTSCRGPGSKPSENHIKAQMWTKIFSDTFLIGSEDIDVNCEYHHQILGNSGNGSARSDFTAVIFNSINQQFPFFIVEFETDGFVVHKDAITVVNATRLHIGLVNGTTICLGSMKAVYDEVKRSLIYVYGANNATFKLHTGNQEADIASALKLVTYLRTNICQDGMALKMLLNRKTNTCNGALLAALPCLPKRAVKSHSCTTEFTPKAKRVKYIDILLEY